MLKSICTILFLFAIAGIILPAFATVYYVDFAGGNDYNNGLTKTAPFKHAPGDPLAVGTAANVILAAGSKVQFKAGVEYKGQVILSRNGTANNYIEFRGQGWGTGRSTFNMEYIRQFGFKGSADYIKISGFNFFHYPDAGSDYVINPSSGSSNWVLDSCTIAYLQDWNNTGIFPDKPCILLTNSINHITIKNCEFFAGGRTMILLRYVSYVTIKNCDFGGINRGSEKGWFSVAVRGEVNCNNIHIEDNKFHDGWQYGGDQVPELNHSPAFIHIYGSSTTEYPYQIFVERNYFYNDKVFLAGTGTGSLEITTQVKNVYVRNNLFANACQYWGSQLLMADGCDNIYIYNNTFIDRDYVSGYGINSIKIYQNAGNNINVRNNIFWSDANSGGDGCVSFYHDQSFSGIINNNVYYRSNPNQVNIFNGAVVSWSAWRSNGLDQNSHFFNLTTPVFVYMPQSAASTSSGVYSVDSDAISIIDKGVTLTGFNDSYNGVTRPCGAAWDLGACEYAVVNTNYINVDSGWNYLSVPKLCGDMSADYLLPSASSPVFEYNSSGYHEVDTLRNGMGYIVRFNNPENIYINGQSLQMPVQVFDRWNLIGPFDNYIPVAQINSNPPGIIASDFYEFDQGFVVADILKPGKAYWVNISGDGTLDLGNGTLEKRRDRMAGIKQNWGKLILTDNYGQSISLYAVNEETDLTSFEFPPVPPAGLFDARFNTGKWAEDLSKVKEILIRSAEYPVTLKVENVNIDLNYEINGHIIKRELKAGEEISLTDEGIKSLEVTKTADEVLPAAYELYQNYPNPFNPVTKIKYSVPQISRVQIVIYDVLGNKIETVLNEEKPAGNYELKWYPENLSSGVYFYEIQAGDFIRTKKMIYLK